MTITEFLIARLDEDEVAANARQGIFPSPSVEDSGAVWLHIKRSGNAVVVHYDHPVSGYGDMADLRAWADTEQGWTQDRTLREIAATRANVTLYVHLAAEYDRTRHGADMMRRDALITVLRHRAAVWSDHADYQPEWKP